MENKTFILRITAVLSLATIFYCLYLYLNPYTFRITSDYVYKIDRVSGEVSRQIQGGSSGFETISNGTNKVPFILAASVIAFLACVILMAVNPESLRKYLSKKIVITVFIVIGIAYFAYCVYVFASLKPGDVFKILGSTVYEKPATTYLTP